MTASTDYGNLGRSHVNDSTRAAAFAYAAAGIPVLPATVGPDGHKRPLIRDWYLRATTYQRTLEVWWANWPEALIGLPTGYRTKLVIVDVDPRNGGDETLPLLPELPETRIHNTRSGGRHYVYRYEGRLPCGTLGPGVDLKADRGFVVAPPSPGYSKANHLQPAKLPRWVVEKVASQKQPSAQTKNVPHPLGGKAPLRATVIRVRNPRTWLKNLIQQCAEDIRQAAPGTRNNTLNQKAYKLAGFVATGYFDESAVRYKLAKAAILAGLDSDEVKATLDSAFTSGLQQPIVVEEIRLGGV